MKLSIIVPFYNVEKYFAKCLTSLTKQTLQDMEIILVDDCSPDGSLAIAEKFAKHDSRIQIIRHTQNLHLGGARNTGLASAKGEYIWFVDSDDWVLFSSAASDLIEIAETESTDILVFSFVRVKQGEEWLYSSSQQHTITQPAQPAFLPIQTQGGHYAWNKIFKRAFLQVNDCVFLTHTVYEDTVIATWLLLAKTITFTPLLVYAYRRNDTSTTLGTPPPNLHAQLLQVKVHMDDFLKDHHLWSPTCNAFAISWDHVFTHSQLVPLWFASTPAHRQTIAHDIVAQLQPQVASLDYAYLLSSLTPQLWRIPAFRKLLKTLAKGSISDKKAVKMLHSVYTQREIINQLFKIIKSCLPYGVMIKRNT
jgi:glycosyltransferase involved in cell wall biosynthesis